MKIFVSSKSDFTQLIFFLLIFGYETYLISKCENIKKNNIKVKILRKKYRNNHTSMKNLTLKKKQPLFIFCETPNINLLFQHRICIFT